MITKWKLFNFKSIQEETDLALGPLTILAGSNSSGKSTVLQSMLLISQTLSSKVRSRSVVLNGPLVKLGQFDDLRSHNGEANQILIGWECQPQQIGSRLMGAPAIDPDLRRFYGMEESLKSVACEVSFEVDPSDPQRDLLQLQPRLFGCTLEVSLELPRESGAARLSVSRATTDPGSKASDYEIEEVSPELLSLLEYDVSLQTNVEREPWDDLVNADIVGCDMDHFLPSRLVVRYDSVEENANLIVAILTDNSLRGYRTSSRRFRNVLIPRTVIETIGAWLGELLGNRLLNRSDTQLSLFADEGMSIEDLVQQVRQLNKQDQLLLRNQLVAKVETLTQDIRQTMAAEFGKNYQLTQRPLPGEIRAAAAYLNRFFGAQMKYLGPLRDEPKPLYPLAPNVDPADIGYRGEHTASVLDLHKGNFVRYLPSANFEKPEFDPEPTTRTLERAVFDWLKYMGVAEHLITRDRGKLGHELKVTTAGNQTPHDLTHVGVGVSQVLPILVMCLLAEPDTTLIIEQPELHLHPKVQTLLGDFFLSMAMLGKQIIVETHSEYIINRLRFRAAAAEDENVANKLKIFFVEKKEGASQFREVNVNQYGAIIDWPEGFFDQSQSEAEEILRAATRKRKAARQKERDAKRNN
jgi:predicted ATPase